MSQRQFIWWMALLALIMGVTGVTAVSPTTAPLDEVTTAGSKTPDSNPHNSPTYVEQVVELVNVERWNNGQLPPLKSVNLLHTSAQTHSDNMAGRDFFAHCDLDTGASPWDRMIAAGYNYSWAGENIAAGYGSPADVMNGWMNSSGHRANILSTSFREVGVGYTYQQNDQGNIRGDANGDCAADQFNKGPYYRYWTQNFGTRSDVYPVVINREAYETETPQVSLYLYGQGWATEMRFRNEAGSWSAWQPFSPTINWTLSTGNGIKTMEAEIRNGSGSVRSAADTIFLNSPVTPPLIILSPASIAVLQQAGSNAPVQIPLRIENGGTELLHWSATDQPAVTWLAITPHDGNINGGEDFTTAVTLSPQGLASGYHYTQLQITGDNASNSPQSIPVTLIISEQLFKSYLPVSIRP